MASKRALDTKAAGVVGAAVMCSRVLGLVREQLFAALFGGGRGMDCFTVAFRAPNLLRDLFAEGALSTAFVTTFSKTIEKDGEGAAWRLASKVATLATVVLSAVVLLGILVAPWLVGFFAPGFDAEKAALTVWLARLMYPFILFVSLAALAMGMLNAKHVFAVPAMASSFFNIGSIVGGAGLGWLMDPAFGPRALTGLAIGTLIGGALQLLVQVPSLLKAGFRFRPDFAWRDPGVRQIVVLMGPAVLAAGSVQLNVMINTMFASTLEDGAIFALNIAFRLMQLPLGIFGVALGTVTLPVLSKSIAAGDRAAFRAILARGMRLALMLTLPCTIGLVVLAEPIISVLYQHGRFTAADVSLAAAALRTYAVGLCAYSAMKVLVPAFYAIDRRKTPMLVSFAAVAVNAGLNWLLTFRLGMGVRGLALSTGCVATINFAVLYLLMRKEVGMLETTALLKTLGRLVIPCGTLGLACWAASAWPLAEWATMAFAPKAGWLLGAIAVASGAYFAVAWCAGAEEVRALASAVGGKLGRMRQG